MISSEGMIVKQSRSEILRQSIPAVTKSTESQRTYLPSYGQLGKSSSFVKTDHHSNEGISDLSGGCAIATL
jgi:hypothetical protein